MNECARQQRMKEEDARIHDKGFVMSLFSLLAVPQRAAMALRCCEKMSFDEIGDVMGGGWIAAKAHFGSAKLKLSSILSENGIDRRLLVPLMINFGMMTGCEMEVSVMRMKELMGEGRFAAIKDRIYTTLKLLAYFWVLLLFMSPPNPALAEDLNRSGVKSVRYVTLGVYQQDGEYKSKGAYENCLYYPEGPDGPVFYRMQRWDDAMTFRMCSWLDNGDGVYYYHSGEKTIYIGNRPMSKWLLPTDGRAGIEAGKRLGANMGGVIYTFSPDGALITGMADERMKSLGRFEKPFEYNTLDASFFERETWVPKAKIVDNRDEMHKRGWTYAEITGSFAGKEIRGRMMIPFTYNMYLQRRPWLELNVGGDLRILDSAQVAVIERKGAENAYYEPGSFFRGLDRPWRGYVAEEEIVRHAVQSAAQLSTFGGFFTLKYECGEKAYELTYQVDQGKNLTNMIGLKKDNDQGMLMLNYYDEVKDAEADFIPPAVNVPDDVTPLAPPANWLIDWVIDPAGTGEYNAPQTAETKDIEALREKARSCRPPVF